MYRVTKERKIMSQSAGDKENGRKRSSKTRSLQRLKNRVSYVSRSSSCMLISVEKGHLEYNGCPDLVKHSKVITWAIENSDYISKQLEGEGNVKVGKHVDRSITQNQSLKPTERLTPQEIDVLKLDDKRRLVSQAVIGYCKTGKRSTWSFHKPKWWPEDIPFVHPKAKIDGAYAHNWATLARVLKACHGYNDTEYSHPDVICCSPVSEIVDGASAEIDVCPEDTLYMGTLNGFPIYQSDIDTLSPKQYISDSIVNGCLGRYRNHESLSIIDCLWTNFVQPPSLDACKVNLFPVCLSSHWFLLAVEGSNAFVFDSLSCLQLHVEAVELLNSKYGRPFVAKNMDVQQQHNSCDCAVHTIASAWFIAENGIPHPQNRVLCSITRRSLSRYVQKNMLGPVR